MTKFLQANRSEIGLVDRFDLSEIYSRDSRFALSNMLLDPDGLDQIYKLSADGLTKEDIRTVGGLDRPVIHSLGISNRVIGAVSNDLRNQITTDKAIGEPGKQSFVSDTQSDNLIVFAGGIAANKIEYDFLDEEGEVRTTTVPTSRESLFSSEKNDQGFFEVASYPGLFRIRRRSHVNEIKLSSTMLVEKAVVVESPTDLLKIPVYMRTQTNILPNVTTIEAYATKNSPLILPVRITSSASISFSRNPQGLNASSPPFVFGWELRRFSDDLLVRGASVNSGGNVSTVNISINVSGTLGAGVDCLLFIYLNPEVITIADLSGIGLKEIGGGQDVGLVGFNSLEELDISGNELTTFPVWLKTLNRTLKKLNIRGNPFWNNGIVSYFDYQDFRGSGITGADTAPPPLIAATQVLGYSGIRPNGSLVNGYAGIFDTVQDTSGRLYKDTRVNAINGSTQTTTNAANGFRVFSELTDLDLGWRIRMVNPDFSRLFPNLQNLRMGRPGDDNAQVYWGLIPKLNNSGRLMTINLSGHRGRVGGSIKYMGNTLEWDSGDSEWNGVKAAQFIGQFNITSFDVDSRGDGSYSGGVCTDASDVPSNTVNGKPRYHHIESGSVTEAWSGWLSRLQVFNARRTDIAFKIAKGGSLFWNNLRGIDLHWIGNYGVRNKVEYNAGLSSNQQTSNDILNAPQLTNIQGWRSGWWGRIFSIEEAPRLTTLQLGANEWLGYETSDGKEHLLPTNFVKPATSESFSSLRSLSIRDIWGAGNRNLEFRITDFQNIPKLDRLELREGFLVGKFPNLPNNNLTTGVEFSCWIRNNRFRDLGSLGSSISPRVRSIWAPNQGSGVGGALLPLFSPQSTNTALRYVNFDSSLSTRYPGNWSVVADRNKVITSALLSTASETSTPSVTWTSKTNNGASNTNSDKLFHNNTSSSFFPIQEILVGDEVFDGGQRLGAVTQIDRNHQFIYINSEVSIVNTSLSFRRRGQGISNFFNNHINLENVYLRNCRLVGRVPEFQNCTRVRQIFLSDNLLSEYVSGTLKNLTGVSTNVRASTPLNRFFVNNNPLPVGAIRNIISDLHDIAVYFSENNLRINLRVGLLGTKLNISTKEYQNYLPSEIFNQTSTSGDGNIIPDPLQTKFNQLGPGSLYPGITVELF